MVGRDQRVSPGETLRPQGHLAKSGNTSIIVTHEGWGGHLVGMQGAQLHTLQGASRGSTEGKECRFCVGKVPV